MKFRTPLIVVMVICSAAAIHAAVMGTPCEQLKAMQIPQVNLISATIVDAGTFTPPKQPSVGELPAFCRVEAVAHPTEDSEIRIEIWMPLTTAWNGKFEGVGNGGYQGNVSYAAMAEALRSGYATASTDTGHEGDDLKFGAGHPEKVVDWAYRSIHVTAQTAKLLIRNHLGRFPAHSYFVGCSTGGHQALSEAQRFPEDYDGIVAGDPGYDRVHQTAAYLWSWRALHDEVGKPIVSAAKLALVTHSTIAACDALDGIKDGIVTDPRRCKFDVGSLLCTNGKSGDDCLTRLEIAAIHKVYAGTRNPRTGELIFPGWTPGTENFGPSALQGWGGFLIAPKDPMRSDVFRYFLFNNPSWDWRTFDFDRDMSFADDKIGYMAAVNPDLNAFRARGGKLVMYEGWADPVAAPYDVIQYYDRVAKTMGGLEATSQFFRFFLVPGMGHCGGGAGPNTFNALRALDTWVIKGERPTKIVASHLTNGKPDRTRPLCPYPAEAQWTKRGSSDEAANFVCRPVNPKVGKP